MVRVRPAVPSDLGRIIEIAARSATSAQWEPSQYEQLFAAPGHPSRTILVVEEGEGAVGFIVAWQVHVEWEIENIAVTGPARRRGLGSRLLGEFLDRVRSQGGSQVFLEVRESNHAALMLYEKWAFELVGRRKGYYRSPEEDALLLRISFSPTP